MEQSKTLLWGFPMNARKAHLFPENDMRSLCRGWIFSGGKPSDPFNPEAKPGPDDCRKCLKIAGARKD